MEVEALNAMNEEMYLSLGIFIKVIVLITVLLASAGFAIYLAGIAWLCFKETRQMKPAPPEPNEYNLSAVLVTLDDDLGDNLTGSLARPAPGVPRISSAYARQLRQQS